MSVDEWEVKGSKERSTDIIVSTHMRESMLKNLGYTQRDIAQATRVVLKIRPQRKLQMKILESCQWKKQWRKNLAT
jgi:Holliday junction resolvasome RuvABC DNA-binding subunit